MFYHVIDEMQMLVTWYVNADLSASVEIEASRISISLTDIDREDPLTTAAVTVPCATYTIVDVVVVKLAAAAMMLM